MTNVYIFAPTKTHAHSTAWSEDVPSLFPGIKDFNFLTRTFQEVHGTRFDEGDVVLIRGLKSIQNVWRMKQTIDELVLCAAYRQQYLVMISLDNYRVVSAQPQLIIKLPESLRKVNTNEFEEEPKREPIKVDKPEYEYRPGFFAKLFQSYRE